MKKIAFTFLLLLSCCHWLGVQCLRAQCPGNLVLTTQAQVNNFPIQYPNCDSLPGSLYIGPSADIADLTPLRQLRWVYRSVVISDNADLTTLAGLDSLFHLAHAPINNFTKPDSLAIQNNDRLRDLRGLGNPATRFGKGVDLKLLVADNDSLLTLEGLEAYTGSGWFSGAFDGALRRGGLTVQHNPQLANLHGLRGLTGGIVDILDNDQLATLDGFGKAIWVEISNNDALSNLHGLDSLTGFVDLRLEDNKQLQSLSGLDNLQYISGGSPGYKTRWGLTIKACHKLQNLQGLGYLRAVRGHFSLLENEQLANLDGLDSLRTLDYCDMTIGNNLALQNIEALGNVQSMAFKCHLNCEGGTVSIGTNPKLISLRGLHQLDSLFQLTLYETQLPNLQGLDSLKTIRTNLEIFGNDSLATLAGLENLTSIGGDLHVESNPFLTSLSGLDNLTSIGGDLYVESNPFLTSLSGLDNINPATITGLFIGNNLQLILCDVQSVCNYLENGGTATVFGNAPGCNSVAEIEAACIVSIEETSTGLPVVTFFPNPASDFLQIQVSDNEKWEISLFDLQGRLLRRQSLTAGQMLDVQGLAAGLYALKVVVGERVYVGRFVKQ